MEHDQRFTIDTGHGLSTALRRTALLLVALSVGLLSLLLLFVSVQAVGSLSAEAAARPHATAAAHDDSDDDDDDDGDDNSDDNGDDDDDDDHEVRGQLLSSATSFVGEWVLVVDSDSQITVVLTTTTQVGKFDGQLPVSGDWLEAEGSLLSDGRLEAQKVRPDDFEANEVIVRLKADADPVALADSYEMTMSAVLTSANIYLFTTTDDEEGEVSELSADPGVEWAEINWVSRMPTGDPYRTWKWGDADASGYVNQRAFVQVNLAPALEKATGAGVTVAILDTGLDLEHPVFANRLTLLPNSDMISDTNIPDDVGPGLAWGHGTHIAGVIRVIAPDATLMPIRVLDSQGRGNTFVLAYAIELAVANGAKVINLSLGADCSSRVLRETVQAAIANGVVVVAAAGNDNSDVSQCPASLPGVLAVAAVDEERQRTAWSNYGDWVSLAAPGEGITSTFPMGVGAETNATPGYAIWSGTSMATPFVAGAAALAVEYAAIDAGSLTAVEMLAVRGDDISALNPAPVGRHLNIGATVDGLPPEPEPTPTPAPGAAQLFLPVVTR
jgi:thermitase